ncbi:hypothetical protein ACTFIR_010839 [Dictyostelium discoideum]
MIEKFKIKPCDMTKIRKGKLYRICSINNQSKVKDLINSCISMILLNVCNYSFKEKKEGKLKPIFSNVNQLRESIKSIVKLDRNQTILDFFLNQNSSNINSNENEKYKSIINLFEMHCSNGGSSTFYSILTNRIDNENGGSRLSLHDSLRFGKSLAFPFNTPWISLDDFGYLECFSKVDDIPLLFQFETNRENQIQFIKKICKEIINSSKENLKILFFSQVIFYDDLEFIQLTYSELSNPTLLIEKDSSRYRSEFFYIRSIKVLEFIYNNCIKNKNKVYPIAEFVLNNRLDLIEKYKLLLPQGSKLILGTIPYFSHCFLPKVLLKGIKSFIDYSQLSLDCADENGIIICKSLFCYLFTFEMLNPDFYHITNHKSTKIFKLGYRHFSNYTSVIFSRWLFFNKKLDKLPDGYCLGLLSTRTLRFSNLNINTINGYDDFINDVFKFKIKIDEMKNKTIQNTDTKFIEWFHNILVVKSQLGDIRIFKSIVDNGYKSLFSNTSTNNNKPNGIFNKLQVRKILSTSLKHDHLELSLYLLKVCEISIPTKNFFAKVKPSSIIYNNLPNQKIIQF